MKKIEKLKLNKLQREKLNSSEMKRIAGGQCACGGICFGSISTEWGEGWSTGYSSK